MLDRVHGASDRKCSLPQVEGVRRVVENGERSEATAQEIQPHHAVVSFSAEASADLARRFCSTAVLVPTSYQSSVAQQITVELFPTETPVEEDLSEERLRAVMVEQLDRQSDCTAAPQEARTVLELLDSQYAAMKAAAADETTCARPDASSHVYISNAMVSDVRDDKLPQPVLNDAQASAFPSFFTRPADGACNIAVPDDYQKDARSLRHSIPDRCCPKGVFESVICCASGGTLFPLQDQQLGMHFTSYQHTGESFWGMLRTGQEEKIGRMVHKLAIMRAQAYNDEKFTDADANSADAAAGTADAQGALISWTLYLSNSVLPTPDILKEHKIKFDLRHVREGQAMTGRGPHFRVCVGREMAVSLSSRQLDEQWLFSGIAHMELYFKWLAALAALSSQLVTRWMQRLAISDEQMRKALSHCPPNATCALLTALQEDPADSASQLHRHVHAFELVNSIRSRCKKMHTTLHSKEVIAFLEERFVKDGDPLFRLCDCESYVTHAYAHTQQVSATMLIPARLMWVALLVCRHASAVARSSKKPANAPDDDDGDDDGRQLQQQAPPPAGSRSLTKAPTPMSQTRAPTPTTLKKTARKAAGSVASHQP